MFHRPSFSHNKGKCLTVVFRGRSSAKKALTKPVQWQGIPYSATISGRTNYDIQHFVISDIYVPEEGEGEDDNDDDAMFGAMYQAIQAAFREYGTVAKLTVPHIAHDGLSVALPNIHIYLARNIENAPDIDPSQYFPFPTWRTSFPIRLHSETVFCNFCRQDGHGHMDCPSRLKLHCTLCNTPGHRSDQCSIYGARDRAHAQKRGYTTQPPQPPLPLNVPIDLATESVQQHDSTPTSEKFPHMDIPSSEVEAAFEEAGQSPVVTHSEMPSPADTQKSMDMSDFPTTTIDMAALGALFHDGSNNESQQHTNVVPETTNNSSSSLPVSADGSQMDVEFDDARSTMSTRTTATSHSKGKSHSSDSPSPTPSTTTSPQSRFSSVLRSAGRALFSRPSPYTAKDSDAASIRSTTSQRTRSGKIKSKLKSVRKASIDQH
ncbi:hypothetical protein BGZ99_002169 [Dissophora globulifera]|uniref:CCHC-type domain-containing protein n=1 Tax=Dissophora globulifera TaxID=979702 RepID=A0A9P6QZG2_9FUNG|nr:hypothetical protein BGZ99_002169 [Dissophora globulifera]